MAEGPILRLIDDALRCEPLKMGRTMPAANMVLGPYDVPGDFFPDYRGKACGPVDWVEEDDVMATYKATFRTERPDHVILSLCYLFSPDYGLEGHIDGALGALEKSGSRVIDGPTMGDQSYFFDGSVDDGRLHKYQALWTHGNSLCELGLVGPPGFFEAPELHALAAAQNFRVEGELRAPLRLVE
jgi:hypothetical protein